MTPKHTVNREDQGMLLAPTKASVAFGQVVPSPDEGFFPATEADLMTPEQHALAVLTYEQKVLDNYATECAAEGSKTNADNMLHSMERLEDYDEIEWQNLTERRTKAESTIRRMRIAARTNFALSLGIATKVEIVAIQPEDEDETPEAKPMVLTEDPAAQDGFDALYREFRITYGTIRNSGRRDEHRDAIQAEKDRLQAQLLAQSS